MNFKQEEFACKCCGMNGVNKDLIAKLQIARDIAGIPFVILSGMRCRKHNKDVGGKTDSAHIYGLAADIKAESGEKRFIIARALLEAGFVRLGIYQKQGFIHADIDSTKPQGVIW